MSSEDPTSLSKSHSYSKYLKKDKWKSKVAAMKAPKELDQGPPPPANDAADIDDFLRPSTMKARPMSPKLPRIGIDVAAARQAPAGESLATPSIIRKRDYPRRALNLRVAFTNSPPAIIGAGGEESEEPTIEISKARPRFQDQPPILQRSLTEFDPQHGQSQTHRVGHPGLPAPHSRALDPASDCTDIFAENRQHSSFPTEEPDFMPNPIKRAPTLGVNTTFDEQQNLRPSIDSDAPSSGAPSSAGMGGAAGVGRTLSAPSRNFQLPQHNSVMDNSPMDLSNMRAARRQSTLDSPVIQEKINKMRQEEGKTLHAAVQNEDAFDGAESSRFSSSTIGSTVRSSEDNYTRPPQVPDYQSRPLEDNLSRQQYSSGSQRFSPPRQSEYDYSRSVQTSGSPRASQPRASEPQYSRPSQTNGSQSQPSEVNRYHLASVAEQITSQSRPEYTQAFSYGSHDPQLSTPSPLNSFPTPGYPTPGVQRGLSVRKPVPASVPLPQTAASSFASAQESGLRPSPLPNPSIPHTPDYFSTPPHAAEHPAVHRKDVNAPASWDGLNDQISQTEVNAEPESSSASSSAVSKAQQTPCTAINARPPPNANPATAFGLMALEDFADRCSHMDGIFRLQAEFERPIGEFTPTQWLRNAAWWFLKGRAGIEGMVRALPRGADGRPQSQQGDTLLSQPHVDLAKCWWILNDVIVNHATLRGSLSRASEYGERSSEARSAGNNALADLLESADILMANLRAVLSSMKRNNVMPPTHALIQGQDQSVWVRHANLAPNLLPILSGNLERSLNEAGHIQLFSPLSVMAVGETRNDFSYTSMFVKATLGTRDENSERIALPCLLSVMRERNDWHQKVAICTQKEIVTLCIQGDRRRGPSWKDVKWNEQTFGLLIQLPHGYSLALQLSEVEFKQLYTSYNHSYRVQSSLLPRLNEQIIYEVSLRDLQYTDSNKPPAFPSERMKRCRIRVFQRAETRVEGTGERKFYRGFRILAVTSPKNKVLASASHEIGYRSPILLGMASDAGNHGVPAPAMTLEVQESGRQCRLLMVFNHAKDCHGLWNTLNNSIVGPDEMQCAALQLKTISVESIDPIEAYGPASRNPLGRLTWQELIVINGDPRNPDHDIGQTVLSDSLRIISQAAAGTMTDRVNVGPGEMRIRLQTDGGPELVICRPPQDDLSLSLDSASKDPYMPKELNDVQHSIYMHSSIRTYSFFSLKDLHSFERAITGFTVRYDGIASAFSIARRRAVTALSKHKKIEATKTRIQIVSHENGRMVQLLAFCDDLPQTDALNFQLKAVDVFERHEGKTGKGKYGVKLVDVKFSLPKLDKEEKASTADGKGRVERKFVSLDMLEPPAENDDVLVGFEEEAGTFEQTPKYATEKLIFDRA